MNSDANRHNQQKSMDRKHQHRRRKLVSLLTSVCIALALSSVAFAFAASVMRIPSRYRIVARGATAEGWITAKEPDNHGGLIVYAYNVGAATYSGEGGIGNAFDSAKIGDKIAVNYDPQAPDVSSLSEPEVEFWEFLIGALVFSSLFGLLGTVSLRIVWRVVRSKR